MEKYEIQKLRDLPIEGVAELLGMVVKRHKALCPFHADHHASLSFNTRRNSCRCYVCMKDSVGTIDLVMKYLGKDFLSACRGEWGLSGRWKEGFTLEGFTLEGGFLLRRISGCLPILLLRCQEVCEILRASLAERGGQKVPFR